MENKESVANVPAPAADATAVVKKKIKPLTVQQKRKMTKYAMGGCLAALLVSGYVRSKAARKVHVVSGFALIGLSVYHTSLYPKNMRS
jgi:hypothetical protein